MKRLLKLSVFLSLVWIGGTVPPARAAITSLVVLPATQHIAVGQASVFSVTWQVTTGVGSKVTSSYGTFGTPDLNLGRVNKVLSQTASAGTTATIVETVYVPASVAVTALQKHYPSITYSRDFVDDDNIPFTGSVTIDFTSALGSGFAITREALAFDDGSPVRIAQQHDRLHARAELTVTGSGVLQAQWEVAGPPSTQAKPVYRPLTQVQKQLNAGQPSVFQSPTLPTSLSGLYLLRLHISNPPLAFNEPVIRYFVGTGKAGQGQPVTDISLMAPQNFALLGKDTQFSWQPVKDARVYQLEIYQAPGRKSSALPESNAGSQSPPADVVKSALRQRPLTGVLVPSKKTQTSLTGVARKHLLLGQVYFWRLLAIDANGAVIGRSVVRELRIP